MNSKSNFQKEILAFFILLTLSSCGPKPWPDNSLSTIRDESKKSEEYDVVVNLLDHNKLDTYFNCILSTYKQKYPDYSEFEKAIQNEPQEIKELTKPCAKNLIGNDFNTIWNMLQKSPNVQNIKSNLSEKYFTFYKNSYLAKLKSEYHSMDNLLDNAFNDPNRFVSRLEQIDTEIGNVIIDKKREEAQKLQELENLYDTELYNYGTLYFLNSTSNQIKLSVGYYYYGSKWKGWTNEGWWLLEPGEKANINIPLNEAGYLNRYYYYTAKSGTSVWGGSDSFLASDNNFKIPNADKAIAKEYSSDFFWLDKYAKVDMGSGSTEHTINFTNNN